MNSGTQNAVKKRVGLALRRYIEADQLSKEYKPYFGCDAAFLRRFIGHQFNGRMSWDNFGTVWKIGHIVPLAKFDQTDDRELKLCWNWVNLRPVRDSAARSRLSGLEAIRLLEWRNRFFGNNPVVAILLERARVMADEEDAALTDWSMFHGEH